MELKALKIKSVFEKSTALLEATHFALGTTDSANENYRLTKKLPLTINFTEIALNVGSAGLPQKTTRVTLLYLKLSL